MDVEKQFLSYVQQIIKADMPDDLKVKMIFDQLSARFKEAVKEQY